MTKRSCLAIALAALLCAAGSSAGPPKWVSAYYGGWWQGSQLNPEEIEYSAVTHIIHFALVVNANGTFAGEGNGITPVSAAAAVRAAHAAGKRILITIGGSFSNDAFAGATSPGNRGKFVAAIVRFMSDYGYDGVDVDWEPLQGASNFLDLVRELKQLMTSEHPGSILTIAVGMGTDGNLLASVAPYVDQINIMTYDMSGPWSRWETWHNTALFNGGATFQSTGRPLPCADQAVRDILAAGVPAAKLGIGIDFYGYRWWGGDGTSTGGVTRPRQAWKTTPNVKDNIPYFQLMDMYARQPVTWDSAAQAAYISIDKPGSAEDEFISFDNERTICSKADYVKQMGLGGVIVYELGAGYRRNLPAGYRDILLQTVRYAFMGGRVPMKDDVVPSVRLLGPTEGAPLSGTVPILAEAEDNSSVAGVEFRIDGELAAPIVKNPPYTISVNTWRYVNGNHSLEVAAFDAFGNMGETKHLMKIANIGSAPAVPDRVVYDDVLREPFVNTSWGASVDFSSHAVVRDGSSSAEVSYMAWGALDILSGTWGKESPVDPSEYDTLRAEIYPLGPAKLKIAFYNGVATEVTLIANAWNTIAVPLIFPRPFTRFYFQSLLNKPVTCYFDNIRFTARVYRASASQ
ncbi:MAG TPA: glycosyl hydrolase family 18 protein [Bacteroidota bacterium]|nr:glycosyl hydrolase family 18 protein [Bacteroidota bacterium]